MPLMPKFPWESHGNGNTNMPKMGMGMGRVHVTMGMGMATFSCVPKFPSIGRLDANAICDFRLRVVDISLQLNYLDCPQCLQLAEKTNCSLMCKNERRHYATGPLYSFILQRLLPPRNCFVTSPSPTTYTLYSSRLLSVQRSLDQIAGNRLLSAGSRIYSLS